MKCTLVNIEPVHYNCTLPGASLAFVLSTNHRRASIYMLHSDWSISHHPLDPIPELNYSMLPAAALAEQGRWKKQMVMIKISPRSSISSSWVSGNSWMNWRMTLLEIFASSLHWSLELVCTVIKTSDLRWELRTITLPPPPWGVLGWGIALLITIITHPIMPSVLLWMPRTEGEACWRHYRRGRPPNRWTHQHTDRRTFFHFPNLAQEDAPGVQLH